MAALLVNPEQRFCVYNLCRCLILPIFRLRILPRLQQRLFAMCQLIYVSSSCIQLPSWPPG